MLTTSSKIQLSSFIYSEPIISWDKKKNQIKTHELIYNDSLQLTSAIQCVLVLFPGQNLVIIRKCTIVKAHFIRKLALNIMITIRFNTSAELYHTNLENYANANWTMPENEIMNMTNKTMKNKRLESNQFGWHNTKIQQFDQIENLQHTWHFPKYQQHQQRY